MKWWPWRRQPTYPVRVAGDRIPDGDTVLFPGQKRPISEMVTAEHPRVRPEPGTDTCRLVRPYVDRRWRRG